MPVPLIKIVLFLWPDSHEDHAGGHVQTANWTGDTFVHINDGQGPFHRTRGPLGSVGTLRGKNKADP